ncbi:MAG: Gx transporter family protein [Clostridia bacterium]|nr:Gx transporter family protein [Clostridia bacterium]
MKRSTGLPLKRLTADAMLIGAAMMISYVEAILPFDFIVLPGVKLGLANLAVMIAFFTLGAADAALVSFIRVFLCGMLFGNGMSMIFSLLGVLFAFAGLIIYRYALKKVLSPIGASILCAALHNAGQLIAAGLVLSDSAVIAYAPVMLCASVVCGGVNGMLLIMITRALPEVKNEK